MDDMRRINKDGVFQKTEVDRNRIASDVEAFLAKGGSIEVIEQGGTSTVDHVTSQYILYGKRGAEASGRNKSGRYS